MYTNVYIDINNTYLKDYIAARKWRGEKTCIKTNIIVENNALSYNDRQVDIARLLGIHMDLKVQDPTVQIIE